MVKKILIIAGITVALLLIMIFMPFIHYYIFGESEYEQAPEYWEGTYYISGYGQYTYTFSCDDAGGVCIGDDFLIVVDDDTLFYPGDWKSGIGQYTVRRLNDTDIEIHTYDGEVYSGVKIG